MTTVKPAPAGCVDKLTNCASYGKASCLGQFEQWARTNCQLYCDYCREYPVSIARGGGLGGDVAKPCAVNNMCVLSYVMNDVTFRHDVAMDSKIEVITT